MCVCCISLFWFRNNLRLCQWVRESVKMQRGGHFKIRNNKSKGKPAALHRKKLWIAFPVFPWWLQRFWDEFCSCWSQQKCSCSKTWVRAAQRDICRGGFISPASYLEKQGRGITEAWGNRKDCLGFSSRDWTEPSALRCDSESARKAQSLTLASGLTQFWLETAAFLRSKERKPEKKTVLRGSKLTSERAHLLSCRNKVNRSVSRPDGREAESSMLNLSCHYHSTDAPDLQWFNWQCVYFFFFFLTLRWCRSSTHSVKTVLWIFIICSKMLCCDTGAEVAPVSPDIPRATTNTPRVILYPDSHSALHFQKCLINYMSYCRLPWCLRW